ncbi:MAG: hypothetical protein HRU08_07510, partial [Oleispira sp.]|nr:hypothetical protein [Oleispira sp.]
MWYAVISQDVENSLGKRLAARPAHLERLKTLKNEGRLLIAGPNPAIDSEDPGDAGYVNYEMELLGWMDKPVMVLLNQTGVGK